MGRVGEKVYVWLPAGWGLLEEIKPARINKIRLIDSKSFY